MPTTNISNQHEQSPPSRKRICIVGSGMAGLTAAYILSNDSQNRYDVEVFEQGSKPSLDAESFQVTLQDKDNTELQVDIPMRAMTEGFYPNVFAMYRHLQVPYRNMKFVYSWATQETLVDEGEKPTEVTKTKTRFIDVQNASNTPSRRARGVSIWEFICETIYLYLCFTWLRITTAYRKAKINESSGKMETFRQYAARVGLPRRFVDLYVVPLMSAGASCADSLILDLPACDVVDLTQGMASRKAFIAEGGVGNLEKKLVKGLTIRFQRPVTLVEPRQDGRISVRWPGYEEVFDQVVMAVPPNVVGKIYPRLAARMAQIPTCEPEVILHLDNSVVSDLLPSELPTVVPPSEKLTTPCSVASHYLPSSSAAFAALTSLLRIPNDTHILRLCTTSCPTSNHPQCIISTSPIPVTSTITSATHLIAPSGMLLSHSPIEPIDPSMILSRASFTRVLRTVESREVVNKVRAEDQGKEGVWLVGSWVWDGMVLLEGAVGSSIEVAEALGVKVDWKIM